MVLEPGARQEVPVDGHSVDTEDTKAGAGSVAGYAVESEPAQRA